MEPEDARYSVIRWLPSTTENASVRTLATRAQARSSNSDIQFYHNVMNLSVTGTFSVGR